MYVATEMHRIKSDQRAETCNMTIATEGRAVSTVVADIVAILPVRSLQDGKRRLAGQLTIEQRQRLILRLCQHVVEVLRDSGVIAMIAIVSRDQQALDFGRNIGVETITEIEPGLNAALATAGTWATRQGAAAQLIVLPDLPLLRPDDVYAVAHAGIAQDTVVLCPDRYRAGTNMLLMRPLGAISPLFGLNSFERHMAAARQRVSNVMTYESIGTQRDVDTPEDLVELALEI